jgi:hypothetical protein
MILPEGFDFSQSKLQDFVDCPYRFYLRHVLHAKWPALVVDDALDFERRSLAGARFHRLVQQYLIGVPENVLTPFAGADQEIAVRTWWDNFLSHIPPLLDGEKHAEIVLSTSLNGHRLIAKYDLLLVEKGTSTLTIFDWKTSPNKPREKTLLERIQTRLYRFILAQAGAALLDEKEITPDQLTMVYWYAQFPDAPFKLPYNTTTFKEDQDYFSDLIEDILSRSEQSFFKTSNVNRCRYCIYRSHCDRGVQAGEIDDFEDWDAETETLEPTTDFESIEEIAF